MKLNKDQKQKIALGTMLMVGIVYVTNEFLLSPLASERETLTAEMTASEPTLREMRGQIVKARTLATKGPEASNLLAQVDAMIPDGAPIAWCPPKIVDFFKKYEIDRVSARMVTEAPEKDLIGYRRLVWNLDIPHVDFATFTHALADFETSETLFEFTGFELQAQSDHLDSQRAILTAQNIIKL